MAAKQPNREGGRAVGEVSNGTVADASPNDSLLSGPMTATGRLRELKVC